MQTGSMDNGHLRVDMSEAPALLRYTDTQTGGVFHGSVQFIEAEIMLREGMETRNCTLEWVATPMENKVVYAVRCCVRGIIAASFDLTLTLMERKLVLRFHNIKEAENFYLFRAKLPRLIVVSGANAKLAIPADKGRLIDIHRAACGTHAFDIDGMHVVHTCVLHNDKAVGVLETDSFENRFFCEVFEAEGERYGAYGVTFVHRLHEFDLVEYGHLVPAKSPDYFLKVQDACTVSLTFTGDADGDGQITWMDGLCAVRAGIPRIAMPYYQDKIINKLCLDNGTGKWRIRFQEAEDIVKRLAALTNNQPTLLYLVGWQYTGHDTGYPAIDEVNAALGTHADLMHLMQTARAYNTTISFHDNYDDAYENSPDWDASVVALDASGGMMKCGMFVQGQAYLLSNYLYAQKYMRKRVKKTVEKYNIRDSYHIDVLSGAYKNGRRYDFNPANPAAAKKNLEGKLAVVDEFAKYDVDVTTEDFTSLMIGKISHFWHIGSRPGQVYFNGEEPIPFVPFLYHHAASYGLHGTTAQDVLLMLLYGACYSTDITNENFEDCIDMYHLVTMPWMKLYGRAMTRYEKQGTTACVTYEDGSTVAVDFTNETYTITTGGKVIAKDFTTCVEQSDGVYLAYSRNGGMWTYAVDALVSGKRAVVERLFADDRKTLIKHTTHDGLLSFEATARAVYRITLQS